VVGLLGSNDSLEKSELTNKVVAQSYGSYRIAEPSRLEMNRFE